MTRVVIIGASKGIGLETVRAAIEAGYQVRAFARSALGIAIDDPLLEKMPGDALNPDDIRRAVVGGDVVIQTLGVTSPHDLIFGTTLFSRSTQILVDAMQESGPKRLIAVTGAGAGDSRGRIGPLYDHVFFPLVLQRVYSDKDIAEDIIRSSDLDWTICRPGGLTSGARTGRYRVLVEKADWRSGFISRADVAHFLIQQVNDTSLIGKTPLLIG